jgi:hypothetical protein
VFYTIMCLIYINQPCKVEREHGGYGLAHTTLQFYNVELSDQDGKWYLMLLLFDVKVFLKCKIYEMKNK